MYGDARFSSCGAYRWMLERRWGPANNAVLFVMLNPSRANAKRTDPTVLRCIGFASRWGYTRLLVGNACSLVSTDPTALRRDPSPIGNPENDQALRWMALRSKVVIVAWGAHLSEMRAREVLRVIRSARREPHALRVTKRGAPYHPLYLPYSSTPEPYDLP